MTYLLRMSFAVVAVFCILSGHVLADPTSRSVEILTEIERVLKKQHILSFSPDASILFLRRMLIRLSEEKWDDVSRERFSTTTLSAGRVDHHNVLLEMIVEECPDLLSIAFPDFPNAENLNLQSGSQFLWNYRERPELLELASRVMGREYRPGDKTDEENIRRGITTENLETERGRIDLLVSLKLIRRLPIAGLFSPLLKINSALRHDHLLGRLIGREMKLVLPRALTHEMKSGSRNRDSLMQIISNACEGDSGFSKLDALELIRVHFFPIQTRAEMNIVLELIETSVPETLDLGFRTQSHSWLSASFALLNSSEDLARGLYRQRVAALINRLESKLPIEVRRERLYASIPNSFWRDWRNLQATTSAFSGFRYQCSLTAKRLGRGLRSIISSAYR